MAAKPAPTFAPASVSDDPVAAFLSAYRPQPGVPDELLDEAGRVRPVWTDFLRRLAAMTPEELAERMARGDQYLRDAGVYHRQYGAQDSAERDWPLSHVPVLIAEAEWTALTAGLVQRAELLEQVCADFYGPNRLVGEGWLPPSLVAESPEWLRPLVGIRPASGHFLHFVAFDLGRGPGGRWWVLGDRTQSPSGAGFALENRIATSRVFSDIYEKTNVPRLAGFFRTFRDALAELRGGRNSRIGILTPGTMNEGYWEHAFIARYLGFILLQGEDLTVRNGELMVRTVAGLKPISVLWRRLDAVWTDPLELNESSRLGTPGLLDAGRSGQLAMVNALGSGMLETRALLAFLPRLCEHLTGAPLHLPNIATWWCGHDAEREHVKANAGRMTIAPALSTRLPFDLEEASAIGGMFRGSAPDCSIPDWLDREGRNLVGQEAVTLSTTPALVEGRLVPRPYTLRVYLVRTPGGWQTMPGGFARVGRSEDPSAVAMQQGGSVADVWIVSDDPVPADTMFSNTSIADYRRQTSILPSRAADNLFWLGRYVERAESAIRLLRAWHIRLAETGRAEGALLDHLVDILGIRGIEGVETRGLPQGVMQTIAAALMSASQVRDSFSVDGWMALTDLERTARSMAQRLSPGDDAARAMNVFIRKITGFSGLVHENMYHSAGWRFLSLGRSVERAMSMTYLLADLTGGGVPDGALDVAIEVGDSVMTHRRRFAAATARETVIDLLALDRLNPRAVLYQIDQFVDHARAVAHGEANAPMGALERAMLRLQTDLATADPAELDRDALLSLAGRIGDLAALLARAHLR